MLTLPGIAVLPGKTACKNLCALANFILAQKRFFVMFPRISSVAGASERREGNGVFAGLHALWEASAAVVSFVQRIADIRQSGRGRWLMLMRFEKTQATFNSLWPPGDHLHTGRTCLINRSDRNKTSSSGAKARFFFALMSEPLEARGKLKLRPPMPLFMR